MLPTPDPTIMPTLVARAQAGDADAISAIYQRYAQPLFRFILHRVGDPAVAEDLLQDVVVRMLAGLPHYEQRGYPIGAWLYRIAACRAIDWLRANGRRRSSALEQARACAGESWPDGEGSAVDRQAEQRALTTALAQLPARQAEVIRLRFLAEMPIAAVAARLGLTPSAVKALQHRGLATLRCRLAQEGIYHPAEAV